MVGELAAFLVLGEPVAAPGEEGHEFAFVEIERRIALQTGEQRERGGARRALEGVVIVAGAVGVRRPRGVAYAGLDPVTDRRHAVIGVAGGVRGVGERERPNELLRHAAGEVDDPVMPVVPVETAIGRAVRITVEERQQLGDLGERPCGKEISARDGHQSRAFRPLS